MAAVQFINSSLLIYMHIIKEKSKPPEHKEPFAIPANVVEDVMKNPFAGDGNKTPSEHLQMIEERCSLFKLSGISHDEVKSKLFCVSLKGVQRSGFIL